MSREHDSEALPWRSDRRGWSEQTPSNRYASAAELTLDISRYLHNEPVLARFPSVTCRTRKYFRRHGLGVGIASFGVLLLAGFAIVQSIELRHIAHERDRAARERDRADRIAEFMTGMFKVPDPGEARGNVITAREVLDNASNEIGAGLDTDPELKAKMMYTMAQSYADLGLYLRAQPLVDGAVAIQRRTLGVKDRDTLSSMRLLATILRMNGHYGAAEKLIREALDVQVHAFGAEDPDTLTSMVALAKT